MSLLRELRCGDVRDLAALFVLEALDPADMAAVRAHLGSCPEPHPEFAEIGGVVGYLAELPEPMEPPPAVGERLMAAVRADLRASDRDQAAAERLVGSAGGPARPGPVAAERSVPSVPEPTSLDVLRSARRRPVWRWAAAVAAVVIIFALAAWNLALQASINEANTRAQDVSAAISAASQPGARVATLRGADTAAGAAGFAVIAADGKSYIVIHGLPPIPADRTYEAWFGTNGRMRPAGFVLAGADGLGLLAGTQLSSQPVDLVAITIEKAGGADQPTSAPIVSGALGS